MQSQAERFVLTNLAIIAYADKLLPEQMPAILPPIFKVKDHDVLVFPPFHIDGAYVYSDAIGETAELHNQIAADQATFLPTSLGAAPNHELWIDEVFTTNPGTRLSNITSARPKRYHLRPASCFTRASLGDLSNFAN